MEGAVDTEIVIGECLTREEAEEIITVLAKDGALQDLLVDAQLRTDQHRQNYVKLKAEHERLNHQLKVRETELVKVETEKQDLEQELSEVVDRAVQETENWRREVSSLEAKLPTEESQRRMEAAIKEQLEVNWREKLAVISEENENLNQMLNYIQEENASLRASYKTEVTAVEQSMQEVLLQFESKVSRLEQDKQNMMESPARSEKVNRALHAENLALKSKIKILTSSREEADLQISVLQRSLNQAETELINLESGLKIKLKQSEASNEAFQKQITYLLNQLDERDKIINNHENKSKSLVKDLEEISEKLIEKDRAHQVELSAFEVSKAKEISSLRTEVAMVNQKLSSQTMRVESLELELSQIGDKHSTELQVKEEDLAEAKVEIEDTLQRFEDRKADMINKNKELSLALRDAEDEIERMKKERSRILRDFDEDMARMSFQNEELRKEAQFLKSRPVDIAEKMKPSELGSSSLEDSELQRKCRKYNKLIHKLRHKMSLLLRKAVKIGTKTEKERLEDTNTKVLKELAEFHEKHKQFGAVFTQLEDSERMKEEKMTRIAEVKESIVKLTGDETSLS